MPRPFRLPSLRALGVALGLLAALPAQAQDAPLSSVAARPAEMLPASAAGKWAETNMQPSDTPLAPEALARRIARLYGQQSEMLMAGAQGDSARYVQLLDSSMDQLQALSRREGVTSEARFRELYRSVLAEYEAYYGSSDDIGLDRGDIFALRESMIAWMEQDNGGPLLEDVELPRVSFGTFPMTMNRHVERSVAFLVRKKGHVTTVRRRAATYFPMVEQILQEEGVPDELKYLAVVESALNPHAQSWAGAAGMWQFIKATGRGMGLTINADLDERLDPEKATRAAARHLKELHEMFGGDWQLALSGYNCSPARIKREIRRVEAKTGRKATFWDIYPYIPKETRNYVPMFIATAMVMGNPDHFDLPEIDDAPRYAFDLVPVRGGTSLASIAQKVGTSTQTLRALNPSLRRSQVPHRERSFLVRVPQGSYTPHAEALAALAPSQSAKDHTPRTVAYASTNRRTVSLASYVAETKPARAAATPAAKSATPVRKAKSTKTVKAETKRIRYRVRRGDALSKIARRYGVSVSDLREWNNIRGSKIKVGQRLTIHQPNGRQS